MLRYRPKGDGRTSGAGRLIGMEFYVMRHGQTDWNVQGLFQGDTDVPLNATGIAQAEEAAASLTEGQVDLIVCSMLQRAGQTADIVNRALKCPIIYREELIERGFGEWEGKEIAPMLSYDPDIQKDAAKALRAGKD